MGTESKSNEPSFTSPAELTAILVSAHRAGDVALERAAKRELEQRFDLRVSFRRRKEAQHVE
jgi:hypothetical protein